VSRWWAGLGTGQRVGAVVVALVIVLNAGAAALEAVVGGSPGGPASSSLSTGDDGLRAHADLLERLGRTVVRRQEPARVGDLAVPGTLVVAEPDAVAEDDAAAIAEFVAAGGRLVLTGRASAPLVRALTGGDLAVVEERAADELVVWVPTASTGRAQRLAGDRGSRWADPGELLPVAGPSDGGALAAIVEGRVGAGTVVAVADTALLHNANLARSDNAALAVALVDPMGPVVFAEWLRSGEASGLAAVPPSWKWTAAGLVVAAALGLWAAGARVGPPEPATRNLRPARVVHVDAVAAVLRRAPGATAAAPVPGAEPAGDTVASDRDPGGAPP
jgi:hypothetical protein